MKFLVSCDPPLLTVDLTFDAKVAADRLSVLRILEVSHQSTKCLVLLDGMGSISVALSCIRMLAEADLHFRLGVVGNLPPFRPLIDSWEAARLEELLAQGRLQLIEASGTEQLIKSGKAFLEETTPDQEWERASTLNAAFEATSRDKVWDTTLRYAAKSHPNLLLIVLGANEDTEIPQSTLSDLSSQVSNIVLVGKTSGHIPSLANIDHIDMDPRERAAMHGVLSWSKHASRISVVLELSGLDPAAQDIEVAYAAVSSPEYPPLVFWRR